MTRAKAEVSNDFDTIKEDLNTLKGDAVTLGKHLQEQGEQRVHELGDKAKKQVAEARTVGKKQLGEMERRIKSNPVQSVVIAFCSGLAMNYILGRKSH